MGEGKVASNGIEIWYEDFGDQSNPTVLLIMGADTRATAWPLELIEPIVDTGYHVVRFDNRDIGLSTWIDDFEANPYTLDDMAADAVGLMDTLKIERAHVIGVSMGGMIAQLMAINYPDRALSLTSWMSTYWFADPDIPAMTEEVQALYTIESPPETREEIIEYIMTMIRTEAGSRFPVNEEKTRAMIVAGMDQSYNPDNNHGLAVMSAPSRLDALRKLDVPTLVIHGDEDPIFNYCHGVICAKVIPGAKLYIQKGVGHELPLGLLPETVQVILEHIGSVK
jgi:pimeloyl-ACP methyl ester carboxylesterase